MVQGFDLEAINHLVPDIPSVFEPEGLLPYSQKHVITGSYAEPDKPSPPAHTSFV
jgi:hypothetical protein